LCADAIEEAILFEGPETVAAVFLEPVQNAGGCYPPPAGYFAGVREICDRYGVLLVSDEVICAWGRLGHPFGAQRFDYLPDMITMAKGLTSGYSPLGAVACRDFLAEPFLEADASFLHGITFGGHPVQAAIALKNIEIMRRERIIEHVAAEQDAFHATLSQLLDLPIVGDLRGTGFFYALELVKNRETRESFDDDECDALLRGFVSPRQFERGLICRADDRGDPVVQISPPLVAAQAEFDKIAGTLGAVLEEAGERLEVAA
jgi:adenosylmethionine-8-amino-7-oxononanoate aminotransferase